MLKNTPQLNYGFKARFFVSLCFLGMRVIQILYNLFKLVIQLFLFLFMSFSQNQFDKFSEFSEKQLEDETEESFNRE
jgi:hypothetical protein